MIVRLVVCLDLIVRLALFYANLKFAAIAHTLPLHSGLVCVVLNHIESLNTLAAP